MNITVSKPFLPPLERYLSYLKLIWEKEWLTNNGPMVREFEARLKEYLNLDYIVYVSNGTIALQLALKILNIKGEVITSPFSFIATTSAILWEGCEPQMVDIFSDTLNINTSLIEEAITDRTSAILVPHIFGNPCDVQKIEEIGKKYRLKIIYDGAQAFGTYYDNRSIFAYGDIATISFHATKLFHTVEGGALVVRSKEIERKLRMMRNFGFADEYAICGLGINAKNSELHAAMGLCNLFHVKDIINERKRISERYDKNLEGLPIKKQKIAEGTQYNYSYYPVIFPEKDVLEWTVSQCQKMGIFPKRYFYPSLNQLSFLKKRTFCPVSEYIAERILCLPMYNNLSVSTVDLISEIVINALRG
ncbi:DegT/DnrJ/EryC1/StrS family aminotransferase [Candidatus Methylacidiphilum fumarolicum]|uniref:DegT/DnrJ/EryC1/StrS family aminotransferase n=2 Tax=Candidatus Methylacidiphilum fumarolicum TaxID=591154 RepID=I0K132_METFB|nr:DegT/DnrJ/EryC1/StrS family aminotransferase [Candidatus Methylacidiphilum fumarolicum]MBW6413932.1 DegT/DnrJ/EryC1/StrS family aminotransferase [Candidatus Methylacidiphilum fumarolicum]TFE70481.1 aminotransferase DegT [Candidatus Methylacidiphilum fumarolicum]TFE74801.1 DegT/DnrJ/EryC1/StrS family aminotransferase [Candidatus Methylacidiphilum fumarolicum]TFE76047.1 DegT/DnrJ/EryC1/StrS family aminotransferase [Candidatus Methylacidiphilum fumarolicum]TFE76369.1 aminotransferase DegT [Can